jgi:LacI family transcriptional regulator
MIMKASTKTKSEQPRKPTIKDVATRAGVALGTVSRILNGNTTVAPAIRDHVLSVIGELGYQPDLIARSMRAQKTHVLGCIVTDISQPVAAAMIAGASEVARQAGYALFVSDFHNDKRTEDRILQVMKERRIDGLLVTTGSDEDEEQFGKIRSLPFPVVLWERDFKDGGIDSVLTDHRLGVQLAAEHLIAQGFRSLALVTAHARTWPSREQAAGFEEARLNAHEAIETRILTTDQLAATPVLLTQLASQGERHFGVIANIHDIPKLLKQARELGLGVPDDIGLVSIGDTEILEVLNPAVTAIRGNPLLIGSMAARRLLSRIDGAADMVPSRQFDRPSLIVRASSKAKLSCAKER